MDFVLSNDSSQLLKKAPVSWLFGSLLSELADLSDCYDPLYKTVSHKLFVFLCQTHDTQIGFHSNCWV